MRVLNVFHILFLERLLCSALSGGSINEVLTRNLAHSQASEYPHIIEAVQELKFPPKMAATRGCSHCNTNVYKCLGDPIIDTKMLNQKLPILALSSLCAR